MPLKKQKVTNHSDPPSSLLVLPARIWGTSLEGDKSCGQNSSREPIAATLGVTIRGKNFTKNVYLKAQNNRRAEKIQTKLNIPGRWSREDIRTASIWVLPQAKCSDFTA